MNPIQLQFWMIMTIQKAPIQKAQKVPKQFQKRLIRQFKRKRANRQRSNRHLFTNKDMRM